MRLRVIFKDRYLCVVHKPSGFLVYAEDTSDPNAQDVLAKQLNTKLYPVHRLDKDTCGLLVFAFDLRTASSLKSFFSSHRVQKTYLAFVHGKTAAQGIIKKPLTHKKTKEEQSARTDFFKVKDFEFELKDPQAPDHIEKRSYTLVEVHPKTGRTHQIRKHFRMEGHPIVGDPVYGNSWNNAAFAKAFKVRRTLLSATQIRFQHPVTKKSLKFETKPDKDFADLIYT